MIINQLHTNLYFQWWSLEISIILSLMTNLGLNFFVIYSKFMKDMNLYNEFVLMMFSCMIVFNQNML